MDVPSDVSTDDDFMPLGGSNLEDLKADLIRLLTTTNSKPLLGDVQSVVNKLETQAELVGIGQSSALSGLLGGEWELLYSPEDLTRSSPFFWAFAQAFPENADQIFGITDSIPAPIKEVGPALQTIEITPNTSPVTGKLVSRVKVATLNGMATSIMTTRADIVGSVGVDGLKIRIDTTKPEESTVIQKLPPPLNTLVGDALPPFPSGDALEQVMPGSSTVVMRTTFCDDALRISRNDAKYDEVFVWRRKKFANSQDF